LNMLTKTTWRNPSLSCFLKPEACINLICFNTVDFPDSPAPFFYVVLKVKYRILFHFYKKKRIYPIIRV
jgi:hypothetical protein